MLETMINDIHFENFPRLESERLIFREFDLKDALDIQLIRSDDSVMSYMDSEYHKTIEDSENFISKNIKRYENKIGIFWAIIDKTENKFIGDFAFWNIIRENHRAEIGYTLKPAFWGKGYMTETLNRLIEFGFKDLNLHSFEAEINPKNTNSEKTLVKAGFKKEAYFKENRYFNGEYLDSEIYSLLQADFK
jgi:ribosomal-protein-alanine N-acetyltransferase